MGGGLVKLPYLKHGSDPPPSHHGDKSSVTWCIGGCSPHIPTHVTCNAPAFNYISLLISVTEKSLGVKLQENKSPISLISGNLRLSSSTECSLSSISSL